MVLAVLIGLTESSPAEPRPASESPGPIGRFRFHRVPGNLVKNSSFEHNWFHRAFTMNRRFLLLQGSDMGVGECDGHVDHWRFQGAAAPECWDTRIARSGSRSIRFDGPASGSQLVRFAGEQSSQGGGAHYASFLPMEDGLAAQVARRPIAVSAWCRTEGVPEGHEPHLVLTVECAVRARFDATAPVSVSKVSASVSYSAGSHDWEFREVRIEPAAAVQKPAAPSVQPGPDQEDEKPAGDAAPSFADADDLENAAEGKTPTVRFEGTPYWVTVTLASAGRGRVWFDDVACVEIPGPAQVNRVAHAGFEALDAAGWLRGWSRPQHWGWMRNTYYAFTGWSHRKETTPRGGGQLDRWLAFTGNASLRFQVFPGDQFAVSSEPIRLDQDRPRPLEARAMVKADNLRTLEIMAMDERGEWLPQGDFLGDDMEEPGHYNFGSTGCGTYDWTCVRKYFSPRTPVAQVRLFLCARGFDGVLTEKNLVGHVWFDDVRLFEHGVKPGQVAAASIPVQPTDAPAFFPYRITEVNLGDRLWGRNPVNVFLEWDRPEATREAAETRLEISLTSSSGVTRSFSGAAEILGSPENLGGRGVAAVSAAFEVGELCASWEQQYRLTLRLLPPNRDKPPPAATFAFGTPSKIVRGSASAHALYPGETLHLFAHLNVACGSFPDLARCDVVARGPGGEKPLGAFTDFAPLLEPQAAPDYVNTSHLLQVRASSEGFAVHPWTEPVRDHAASVRLYLRSPDGPKLLVESDPLPFGFLERIPKAEFPEVIRRTAVNEGGHLTINGAAYFPVYWTPHFGVCPEANYPPTLFGCKTLDLTKIVYSKEGMPGDEVKAELLQRVDGARRDPRFFQYELGEGEMQCQGGGWPERVRWLKLAIQWIREADPDHLINGPESWLVGHPHHNEAMKAFVPDWDVIGVEASFETQPKIRAIAGPLMKTRRTAVLVGLETYFYQSYRTLRWRGYRSVLDGASGIGLCPSGMLQSHPDKVNDLRSLNGEFRGLSPVITAAEPVERMVVHSPFVDILERELEGRRYVFAVRGSDDAGPLKARFQFPQGRRWSRVKVRFEARSLEPSPEGFEDDFHQVQTVHVYELEN
ncbi:MAG: hypothetical protein HYU36_09720 [Planctomycetes bacterium]|nr:hypothetical protein [Planctomycetota bacterium]